MKYSPSYIPFDKVSEEKGTIQLKIRNGKLYDPPGNVVFFDEIIGNSTFKLYRNPELELIFEQNNYNNGRREARINLKNMGLPQALDIISIWNKNHITLSVGDRNNKSNSSTSVGEWSIKKVD